MDKSEMHLERAQIKSNPEEAQTEALIGIGYALRELRESKKVNDNSLLIALLTQYYPSLVPDPVEHIADMAEDYGFEATIEKRCE